MSTRTKLVLISIWVRGRKIGTYMVSATFYAKTGKTVVSSDVIKECCKKAGVRDGETYMVGGLRECQRRARNGVAGEVQRLAILVDPPGYANQRCGHFIGM